jgi:uncharacterized protein YbdZ (MbtH family)
MSIEAMKQALETAEGIANSDWRKWEELASPEEFVRWAKSRALHMATTLRQAIDAYTLSSKPPGLCMCGEPWRLESVHRKKSPCFDYIKREWVGLTDDEIRQIALDTPIKGVNFAHAIEQALKEKNT